MCIYQYFSHLCGVCFKFSLVLGGGCNAFIGPFQPRKKF